MKRFIHDLLVVLVFGLLCVNGWGCAGDGRLEIDAPCGMAFSPDPELLSHTEAAAARWSAAAGCDVRVEAGGVPVRGVEQAMQGDTPRGAVTAVSRGIVVDIAVTRRYLATDWGANLVAHEMWHALGGREHTDSGIGMANVGPDLLIDAASLALVCESLHCETFNPEIM